MNSRTRRILSHAPNATKLPTEFYQWEPDARIRAGDIITYIEEAEGLAGSSHPLATVSAKTKTKQNVVQFWQGISHLLSGHGLQQVLAVTILYQESTQESAQLMPADDIRLEVGDRLIVPVTVDSLRRIEQSKMLPRCWQVQVDETLTRDAVFEGARAIARISGCSMNTATKSMRHLPGVLPIPLYKHQAQRLVRELSKVQAPAHLISVSQLGEFDNRK